MTPDEHEYRLQRVEDELAAERVEWAGRIDALLARLTAAEADADRLAELLDRKAVKTPTKSGLHVDFVMHGDFVHQPDVAGALGLHDKAVALRERPQ